MERIIPADGVRALIRRRPLPLKPDGPIAIKRDVHEFEVDVDADAFAEAFRDVMTDPERSFGLIRVKRPADRMGRDFQVGERFQGCFSLERGAEALQAHRPRLGRVLRALLATAAGRRATRWIEDTMLSDYGEIVELTLSPDAPDGARRMRYHYLEGTPIAGSTTFTVEPLGPDRCRVTQVFEYQEVGGVALSTFQRFGLKAHDGVVAAQVREAARIAGARQVSGTIPPAYEAA